MKIGSQQWTLMSATTKTENIISKCDDHMKDDEVNDLCKDGNQKHNFNGNPRCDNQNKNKVHQTCTKRHSHFLRNLEDLVTGNTNQIETSLGHHYYTVITR